MALYEPIIPSQPTVPGTSRMEALRNSAAWEVDYLKVAISEELWRAMDSENVHQAELARRVGKSRAYITRVLRGTTNFTLESVAAMLFVLGYRLEISAVRRVASAQAPNYQMVGLTATRGQSQEALYPQKRRALEPAQKGASHDKALALAA